MSDITNKDLPPAAKEVKIEVDKAGTVAPAAKQVFNYHGMEGRFVPLHITQVINVISDTDYEPENEEDIDTIPFDIQKKIDFNSLKQWAEIIREFGFWSSEVDKIYQEFDLMGRSKSKAVFHWLRYQIYFKHNKKFQGDELFDRIAEEVLFLVKNDPEYDDEMGLEVLTENVYIVLVHAFMKCKIFKKPPVC